MAIESRLRNSAEVVDYFQSFLVNFDYVGEHCSGDRRTAAEVHGFLGVSEDAPLQIGDVALWPGTGERRWDLGWVVEIRRRHDLWQEYRVQSVFDGSLGWQSDNGIAFLERRRHQERWSWSDRQLALQDRWLASGPQRKAGREQPVSAFHVTFRRNREVTLRAIGWIGSTREDFDRTFPDWRKVTKAQMREFLAECAVEHKRAVRKAKQEQGRR